MGWFFWVDAIMITNKIIISHIIHLTELGDEVFKTKSNYVPMSSLSLCLL